MGPIFDESDFKLMLKTKKIVQMILRNSFIVTFGIESDSSVKWSVVVVPEDQKPKPSNNLELLFHTF